MEGLILDSEAIKACNYIRDNAKKAAQVKMDAVQLENFRKTKKSMLILASKEKTDKLKEADAYAHQEMREVDKAYSQAKGDEEEVKWMMKAAELKIDIYRTQQANIRKGS